MTSLLEVSELHAGYGRSEVVRGVGLDLRAGSVTALLGANGAGKTTLLRAIAGAIRPSRGRVMLDGQEVTRLSPRRRVEAGLCLIPEGRGIFRELTVRENLVLNKPGPLTSVDVDLILEVFPALRDRLADPAGRLSGGQQQMVALSRAFLSEPKVVLLDEVSLGLAPIVLDQIFTALALLAASGAALLIVEQYVDRALAIADHVYLVAGGSVTFSGSPDQLKENELSVAIWAVDCTSLAASSMACGHPARLLQSARTQPPRRGRRG